MFVFGSSRGILAVSTRNYDATWLRPRQVREAYSEDIFALETIPESPHVLLSGGRPGVLESMDFRVSNMDVSTIDVIHHPGPITHIKSVGNHGVVVAGLDCILRYDLRFCKSDSQIMGNQGTSSTSQRHTKPILRFDEYKNSAAIQIGLDVDLDTGVLAAAQDRDERIALYSVHTGRKLGSYPMAANLQPGQHTRCVRFAQDDGDIAKSLYFTKQNVVERWVWAEQEDRSLSRR